MKGHFLINDSYPSTQVDFQGESAKGIQFTTILYEEKESMQRDDVNGKSPYFLYVNIPKEISSYGVEQKMNDYIGLQKTIIPIFEEEGFFREVINEEMGMVIEITKKGIKETLGSEKRF